MPGLQQSQAGHAPAVLAFELANRAYFTAFISDRGDDFYQRFTDRHNALLAEQETRGYACYVHVAGRGVATATVRAVPAGCAPQGSHPSRECRVPEGADQGRVHPGWAG